jgi:hypothetical protein
VTFHHVGAKPTHEQRDPRVQILFPPEGRPRAQGCRKGELQLFVQSLAVLILLTLPVPTYAPDVPLPQWYKAGTATSPCPTYLTVLVVDSLDATPKTATPGMTVTITFRATYPEGTPAQITNASFLWEGTRGQEEFDNVGVAPNGSAGFYQYRQHVTPDLVHAVGLGHAAVSIIACSLRDPLGNDGPNQNTSTQVTLTKPIICYDHSKQTAAQQFNERSPLLILAQSKMSKRAAPTLVTTVH